MTPKPQPPDRVLVLWCTACGEIIGAEKPVPLAGELLAELERQRRCGWRAPYDLSQETGPLDVGLDVIRTELDALVFRGSVERHQSGRVVLYRLAKGAPS